MGTHKKCITEALLKSTYNICFRGVRKNVHTLKKNTEKKYLKKQKKKQPPPPPPPKKKKKKKNPKKHTLSYGYLIAKTEIWDQYKHA